MVVSYGPTKFKCHGKKDDQENQVWWMSPMSSAHSVPVGLMTAANSLGFSPFGLQAHVFSEKSWKWRRSDGKGWSTAWGFFGISLIRLKYQPWGQHPLQEEYKLGTISNLFKGAHAQSDSWIIYWVDLSGFSECFKDLKLKASFVFVWVDLV